LQHDQFVDSKYLSQALSEAEENYEPEMAGVSTSINTSKMRQIIAKLMTVLMINRFEILMHG